MSHLLKTALSQPQKCLRLRSLWPTADCTALDKSLISHSWENKYKNHLITVCSDLTFELNNWFSQQHRRNPHLSSKKEQAVYTWAASIALVFDLVTSGKACRPIGRTSKWRERNRRVATSSALFGLGGGGLAAATGGGGNAGHGFEELFLTVVGWRYSEDDDPDTERCVFQGCWSSAAQTAKERFSQTATRVRTTLPRRKHANANRVVL